MNRRDFLATAVAGALAAGCSGGGGGNGMGSMMPGAPAGTAALPEGQVLRVLPSLANTAATSGRFAATLVAQPTSLALSPGAATSMWLYNGLFPGPLVDVREGDRVQLSFVNRLPIDSTIHWHGLPVPSDMDGNPMDPVAPGATKTYDFTIPTGSAGTYWYHPHAHGTTAQQVGLGLAAPFVVRAADDPLASLPEVTMMVTGLSMGGDMQVTTPSAANFMTGGQGDMLLVNGQRHPVLSVRPGTTQRWRILNATAGRYLSLQLDGHAFALVGTDGGLLAAPVAGLAEVLLAPAQRVELVVTVSSAPSSRFTLRAGRHVADTMGMGTYASEDVLTLATTAEPPAASVALPPALRPMAAAGAASTTTRVVLTQSGAMGMMGGAFLINDRAFDMNRVDFTATAGAWERWDLVNDTFMDHPIHFHGTQFRLLSRESGGRASPAAVDGWLDTVDVPAGTTASVLVRQPLAGRRLVHCHILAHEDAGMMATIDVKAG